MNSGFSGYEGPLPDDPPVRRSLTTRVALWLKPHLAIGATLALLLLAALSIQFSYEATIGVCRGMGSMCGTAHSMTIDEIHFLTPIAMAIAAALHLPLASQRPLPYTRRLLYLICLWVNGYTLSFIYGLGILLALFT